MAGMRIEHSARDGVYYYEPSGPIIIANSTIAKNRGHGVAVDNTTDGRVFINMTNIHGNYGDGIWYKQRMSGANLVMSKPSSSRCSKFNKSSEESKKFEFLKELVL